MKYGNMTHIVSKGKVLMIKKIIRENDPNSGYFTLPGGKINSEEKGLNNIFGRRESAIRETLEETGIRMLNPVLQGIILFDNSQRTFSDWKNPDNFIVYIYSSKKFSGKVKASEEGVPYSVPLEKLGEVPSTQGDKLMYNWLKNGRKFFGVIYHKGNEIDEEKSWVDFY